MSKVKHTAHTESRAGTESSADDVLYIERIATDYPLLLLFFILFLWAGIAYIILRAMWRGVRNALNKKKAEHEDSLLQKKLSEDVFIIVQTEALRLLLRHIKTMVTKYEQAIYRDDYGEIKFDKAVKEIEYFMTNVVTANLICVPLPHHISRDFYTAVLSVYLNAPNFIDGLIGEHIQQFLNVDSEDDFIEAISAVAQSHIAYLNAVAYASDYSSNNETLRFLLGDDCQVICDLVRTAVVNQKTISIGSITNSLMPQEDLSDLAKWFVEHKAHVISLNDVVTGQEFEVFCQKRLQELGWDVKTTRATGDFGADLVVERAGCTIIIQCKYYSQPVGVKAVQEAFSAMKFYNADKAAVVSNQSYTKAARQMAEKNNVALLHVNELDALL